MEGVPKKRNEKSFGYEEIKKEVELTNEK